MYIFRENIILTFLGILAGSVLGKILYVFLVSTAEMDNMMMVPTVDLSSYIVSGVITMIFAILVMIIMHRENIILTFLGILAGSVLGKMLYVFLVSTAEMDNMMMIPTVDLSSYIVSGVITMIFAILVMIIMHKKLKNINMIDALKSVE